MFFFSFFFSFAKSERKIYADMFLTIVIDDMNGFRSIIYVLNMNKNLNKHQSLSFQQIVQSF